VHRHFKTLQVSPVSAFPGWSRYLAEPESCTDLPVARDPTIMNILQHFRSIGGFAVRPGSLAQAPPEWLMPDKARRARDRVADRALRLSWSADFCGKLQLEHRPIDLLFRLGDACLNKELELFSDPLRSEKTLSENDPG